MKNYLGINNCQEYTMYIPLKGLTWWSSSYYMSSILICCVLQGLMTQTKNIKRFFTFPIGNKRFIISWNKTGDPSVPYAGQDSVRILLYSLYYKVLYLFLRLFDASYIREGLIFAHKKFWWIGCSKSCHRLKIFC